MASKIALSQGQRKRIEDASLDLLVAIAETQGREEFSLAQILDSMPLEDKVTPEEVAACEQKIVRLKPIFHRMRELDYVRTIPDKQFRLTEQGSSFIFKQLFKRAAHMIEGARISDERVRWSTLGGKPFASNRDPADLMADMLIRAMGSAYYPSQPCSIDLCTGEYDLHEIRLREKTRRNQMNERARVTASFNWLQANGYIESEHDDDVYTTTTKGNIFLDEAA
jgi:predicted transcriptional regulator